MRISVSMVSVLVVSAMGFATAGCGGGGDADADPFDTFQLCIDDHIAEGLSPDKGIVICCIDHPIGTAAANTVCGDTSTTCSTYATANLSITSATTTQITTGCADYVVQRSK